MASKAEEWNLVAAVGCLGAAAATLFGLVAAALAAIVVGAGLAVFVGVAWTVSSVILVRSKNKTQRALEDMTRKQALLETTIRLLPPPSPPPTGVAP
jgi:hypothetical protein